MEDRICGFQEDATRLQNGVGRSNAFFTFYFQNDKQLNTSKVNMETN
jgi:hypothetical protein